MMAEKSQPEQKYEEAQPRKTFKECPKWQVTIYISNEDWSERQYSSDEGDLKKYAVKDFDNDVSYDLPVGINNLETAKEFTLYRLLDIHLMAEDMNAEQVKIEIEKYGRNIESHVYSLTYCVKREFHEEWKRFWENEKSLDAVPDDKKNKMIREGLVMKNWKIDGEKQDSAPILL